VCRYGIFKLSNFFLPTVDYFTSKGLGGATSKELPTLTTLAEAQAVCQDNFNNLIKECLE